MVLFFMLKCFNAGLNSLTDLLDCLALCILLFLNARMTEVGRLLWRGRELFHLRFNCFRIVSYVQNKVGIVAFVLQIV